jgi:Reverse transcriptase (RNA-dependent DNA polymerase)
LTKQDFAFNLVDLVKDPESFDEAYNHPEADKKIMWRRAILKEFEEMEAKGAWEKFLKSEIPNGRNCIKDKWVFKTKRNGIFRAQLVAWGYSQIPRVDFQESYAPVINDVIFRSLLVTMLTWNLSGKVIDIETTFLHGDLKETIFMDTPKGYGFK